MKRSLLTLFSSIAIATSSFGQAPEAFKYQAVIRDASGLILTNQSIGYQIAILQGSPAGTAVYTETFTPTSNAYGLINIEIGTGITSDDFSAIDWSAGPYFVETAMDASGGTSYLIMGTSQLISVPYALHAKTAESVVNDQVDDADADPTNEFQNLSVSTDLITGTDLSISDGNTVNLGTLLQYDPIDPFSGLITNTQIGNWNTAYSWGDHSLVGYLTQSDFADFSAVSAIVSSNISNWNTAFSWGDHSLMGYLTVELDGDPTNELQTLSLAGNDLTISGGNTLTLPEDNDWMISVDDMYNLNTGNIGIGTTAPVSKLHIKDGGITVLPPSHSLNDLNSDPDEIFHSAGTSGDYRIAIQDGYGRLSHYWNVDLNHNYVTTDPSTWMLIDNGSWSVKTAASGVAGNPITWSDGMHYNGSLGVGTSAPNAMIHAHDADAIGTSIRITNMNSTNGLGLVLNTTNDNAFINNQENGGLFLRTNSTTRLSITSTGNVGIGTTNPTSQLEVLGDIELDNGKFAPASPSAATILFGNVREDGAVFTNQTSGGFSVNHLGTGVYEVVFSSPFPQNPTVSVTAGDPASGDDNFAAVNQISTTSFLVYTWDGGTGTNTPEDSWFSLQIIGMR